MKTFLQKVDFFNRHQNKYRLTFRQDLSHQKLHAYVVECEELATGVVKLFFNFNSSYYPTLDRVERRWESAFLRDELPNSL